MFRELIRKKQALTLEECQEVLKTQLRGVMSVLGDNDYPYGFPIDHYYDEQENVLYFHCAKKGHKIDAIKKHNKVSYCVYDEGYRREGEWALNFKSVITFGYIEMIDDLEQKADIIRKLSYKFTQDDDYIDSEIEKLNKAVLVLKLIPEHIAGKKVNEA